MQILYGILTAAAIMAVMVLIGNRFGPRDSEEPFDRDGWSMFPN